jgi:hypothetical protein
MFYIQSLFNYHFSNNHHHHNYGLARGLSSGFEAEALRLKFKLGSELALSSRGLTALGRTLPNPHVQTAESSYIYPKVSYHRKRSHSLSYLFLYNTHF